MIFTVDAASRKTGVALFRDDGTLVTARAVDVPGKSPGFAASLERANAMGSQIGQLAFLLAKAFPDRRVDRVIIEYPRIYKAGPAAKLPGDDLLVLSASAMAAWVNLSAVFPDAKIEPVRPQDWKGQVPKDIMVRRILARLSRAEIAAVADPENDNIVDAVGIGLHACRRL